MPEQQSRTVRPLYFVASYPRSGSNWVRSAIYLMISLSQPNPPKQIDMRNIDNIIPWDAHGLLYKAVTGKDADALDEFEVAEARPQVHTLLATENISIPVVRTHAVRGTFHGHETINPKVTGGATYVVRNPLDVAAALIEETGARPLQVIELMMKTDRRVRAAKHAVVEPHGSWSQNVASWTAVPQPEVLVIRFEDLAKNPSSQLARISEHMRIGADAALIEKANGLLTEMRKREGKLSEPRDYREWLTPVQARAVLEGHAIEMERHGYLTDRVLQYADINRKAVMALATRYAPKLAH